LNSDGISDIAYLDSQRNFIVALGRGNGTFTVTNKIAAISGQPLSLLVMGDFDGDGKVDIVAIASGTGAGHGNPTAVNSREYFYKGNGDGTVTLSGSPQEIAIFGPYGPIVEVTGDFNGDNKLDAVIGYYNMSDSAPVGTGFIVLAGNGDGTFNPSAPVSGGNSAAPMLVGDMNGDHKLDLVWGQSVYLSNGDGTFTLFPMSLPAPGPSDGSPTPNALADLNGDGVLDVVAGSGIYAGYGNGGVQSAPFFSASLPLSVIPGSIPAVVGDVNADGHPDVVFRYTKDVNPSNDLLPVYLGDGRGHFTTDSNIYIAGSHPTGSSNTIMFLTRLNNQAPVGSADHTLDLLLYSNGGATSLLNQNNPAPGPLAPISSHVSISASPTSAGINQQFTFTVSVTGANPTGTVTLKSGSTTLGTKALTGGSATLPVSFTAAGTYAVTATYSGDSNNLTSTSAPVSVTVTPSSTTTTLSISSANVNQAQAITYTAAVTGANPTGAVTFSSGTTTLGKSNVTNGVATLSASFANAGTYSVTASYSGDANNQPSTSSAQSITVVAPDYTLTANPASATVKAGQTANFAISMTSVGGYSGSVKLSCGSLPAAATCTFSPPMLTGSGTSANSTLTITTTAPATAQLEHNGRSSARLAVWAVLLGLCFSPRRLLQSRKHLVRIMAALLLTLGSLTYLAGCSSSSTPKDAGTPLGTQTISVSGADSSSGPSHTLNIQLIVQ
jgi:plastocyanin